MDFFRFMEVRPMRPIWIGIVALALCIPSAQGLCKQTITWYQPDFPPYVITKGEDAEDGIDNRTVQYLIERLPEYQHRFQVASYKRILTYLRNGLEGVVTPLFITPERQQYLVYSDTASYLPLSNGLVVNQEELQRFEPYIQEKGTINIERLMQSGQYTIGITSGRSYSGIIDEMIRKYKDSHILYERSGSDHLGILKMLRSKRINAAFGFPVEVKYLSKRSGLQLNLTVLPVADMAPYAPVFFAAPRNKWGEVIISKINQILHQAGTIAKFNQYYESWLDEAYLPYYRKIKADHYDKR